MLDSGVVTASYTTANSGLKHNWITSIVGVDNDWFLGTYGAGVLKLDAAGRWTSFPDLKGDLVINPNAMIAAGGAIYAGTLGKGLAVYKQERWVFVTRGLPSLNVTALATANGYIYIGTDNGLVRISVGQAFLPAIGPALHNKIKPQSPAESTTYPNPSAATHQTTTILKPEPPCLS